MFALDYLYEGVDDNRPYSQTMAVSENKDKLRQFMEAFVKDDTQLPNPDDDEYSEWSDDINYKVIYSSDDEVQLQHRKRINLYVKYTIREVDVL